MTNEDTAWEQFSKADAMSVNDTSAMGMLQAIMAEINSVKADTAMLKQKIDGGAEEPPMDEGAAPPMDAGMPADMPPMNAGGAPPAGGDMPPMDMGAAPPMDAGAPPMGGPAMPMDLDTGDETLAALQEALSQVADPDAIAKLADIIKDYVAENYQGLGAEQGAGDIPPEAIAEVLAGAEGAPMGAPPAGDELPELTPEIMDSLLKSAGVETESVEKSCEGAPTEPVTESADAPTEPVAESADAPTEPVTESEDAPAEAAAPIQESDEEDSDEPEPAIQINLFLGAKMEDVIDKNADKGLTDKDGLPTESFKVCDGADAEPMKKSIDDLINQNMRMQSGMDGKRYKISKSSRELAQEEYQSIQKSIGSFDAVKDMRVGDILTTMQGLSRRGMTSIEKSYEPLIDEMVKYCDNNISPLYTEPLFKSFGLDIGKVYEDLDLEPFEKARRGGVGGGIGLPNVEQDRLDAQESADRRDMTARGIPADIQDKLIAAKPYVTQRHNLENEMDKAETLIPQALYWASPFNLVGRGTELAPGVTPDMIAGILQKNGVTLPIKPGTSAEEYLEAAAPYLFAIQNGVLSDDINYKRAYRNLLELEPEVSRTESVEYPVALEDTLKKIADYQKFRNIVSRVGDLAGYRLPDRAGITSARYQGNNISTLGEHDLARELTKLRGRIMDNIGDPKAVITLSNGRQIPISKFMDKKDPTKMAYTPDEVQGKTFGTPDDVFGGSIATYRTPGLMIDKKLLPMGRDTGVAKLGEWFANNVPSYSGSALERAYNNWVNVYDRHRADRKSVKSAEFDTTRDAVINALKNIKFGNASGAEMATKIFGPNGRGITYGLFADSPLKGILAEDGRGSYTLDPRVQEEDDAWFTKKYPLPQVRSLDEGMGMLDDELAKTRKFIDDRGVDPASKASMQMNGIINTDNFGNAYRSSPNRFTSLVEGKQDYIKNLGNIEPDDIKAMDPKTRNAQVRDLVLGGTS